MKFLADENIPIGAVDHLQKDGIDIISIRHFKYGLDDVSILKLAYGENRVMITFDKEFGYLVFKKRIKSVGVILLRFVPLSPQHVAKRISELIEAAPKFEGNFIVVEEEKIRIRSIRQ